MKTGRQGRTYEATETNKRSYAKWGEKKEHSTKWNGRHPSKIDQ